MAIDPITERNDAGAHGRAAIALIGCNHRTAPVELRERVVFTPEQAVRAANELCQMGVIEEAVVVSTCNRSELYGVTSKSAESAPSAMVSYFTEFHKLSAAELNGRIYRHAGPEAVRHLFRVACGIDSMLLGEAEILGQVRDAYHRALESGSTGPVLNRLFQGALEVGKRVRAETEIGARPMSVALAGVKLAERIFGELKSHRALIVGAGSVAEQVVEHLRLRGIGELRVVNRSFARAQELAQRMGGQASEWANFERLLDQPDIIVTSVSGSEHVLTRAIIERAMAARSGRAMFVIDLGVPRNVEPEAEGLYNVYLFNIGHLGEIVEQNKKARETEIPRVETIIDEHARKFLAWQSSLEAAGLLDAFRARLDAERRSLLNVHFANGDGLSENDRARIEMFTEELINRIVQLPSARLRQARKLRRPLEGLAALRELFGLDDAGGEAGDEANGEVNDEADGEHRDEDKP
ncbi:MAG TPA: glutamyl-tRNA reductase [Candidatus Limnocylindrales bacterium]|nr:glutamyl-tRNA reductase [Candidatus Limnocylindrales bacterium]